MHLAWGKENLEEAMAPCLYLQACWVEERGGLFCVFQSQK